MSPISCCSPTGHMIIAGKLVVGIAANTLDDREPRAIRLRAASNQVVVTAPPKSSLRENSGGFSKALTAETALTSHAPLLRPLKAIVRCSCNHFPPIRSRSVTAID
jgi:hypothetical protein